MNLKKFLSATTFLLCSLLFVTSCSIKREVSKLKEEITRIEKLQKEQHMKDSLSIISLEREDVNAESNHRDFLTDMSFDNSIIERWEYETTNAESPIVKSYSKISFDKRDEKRKESLLLKSERHERQIIEDLTNVETADSSSIEELQKTERTQIKYKSFWQKFWWLIPLLLLLLFILYSFRRGNK